LAVLTDRFTPAAGSARLGFDVRNALRDQVLGDLSGGDLGEDILRSGCKVWNVSAILVAVFRLVE